MIPILATATLPALGAAIAIVMLALVLAPKMAEPTIPTPQDDQLLLQDTVTKTATFNSAGLDLGSGFAPGGRGQMVSAVVNVSAMDLSSGDESYTFKIQQSSDNVTFPDAGVGVVPTGVGVWNPKAFITKRYVRLVLTVSGSTPSITYKAWLNPL